MAIFISSSFLSFFTLASFSCKICFYFKAHDLADSVAFSDSAFKPPDDTQWDYTVAILKPCFDHSSICESHLFISLFRFINAILSNDQPSRPSAFCKVLKRSILETFKQGCLIFVHFFFRNLLKHLFNTVHRSLQPAELNHWFVLSWMS